MTTNNSFPKLCIHEPDLEAGVELEGVEDPPLTAPPTRSRRTAARQPRPNTARQVATADAQMQLLLVADPLIRRTLEEKVRNLCQELTRTSQTPLEDHLVEQIGVAWSCQAGLKHRLRQPELSGRYRNELRVQFNVALEHFELSVRELTIIRAAIVSKVATQEAAAVS